MLVEVDFGKRSEKTNSKAAHLLIHCLLSYPYYCRLSKIIEPLKPQNYHMQVLALQVKSIGHGKIDRILTAHFASPIAVSDGATDFLNAFRHLDGPTNDPPIACQDWELLDGLSSFVGDNNLGAPVQFDFKKGCPS